MRAVVQKVDFRTVVCREMNAKDDLGFFLDTLNNATGLTGLQLVLEKVAAVWAVDHASYLWIDRSGEHYYFGTYPQDWRRTYQQKDYERVDPVRLSCFRSFHPVDWRKLDREGRAARAFWTDAEAHGLGNQGYSVPVRGPKGQFAVFSVNCGCPDQVWDDFVQAHNRELLLLGHYLNQRVLELEPRSHEFDKVALSQREVDVLSLLAKGQSRAQVAGTLGISEHTLRVYIESARFKLKAANTTQAIANATSIGLIIV